MDIPKDEFKKVYKVGKFLGEGSFAKVYKAKGRRDGVEYAVKMIQLPSDEESRKNVFQEKDVLSQFDNEHIIKCFHSVILKEKFTGMEIYST